MGSVVGGCCRLGWQESRWGSSCSWRCLPFGCCLVSFQAFQEEFKSEKFGTDKKFLCFCRNSQEWILCSWQWWFSSRPQLAQSLWVQFSLHVVVERSMQICRTFCVCRDVLLTCTLSGTGFHQCLLRIFLPFVCCVLKSLFWTTIVFCSSGVTAFSWKCVLSLGASFDVWHPLQVHSTLAVLTTSKILEVFLVSTRTLHWPILRAVRKFL